MALPGLGQDKRGVLFRQSNPQGERLRLAPILLQSMEENLREGVHGQFPAIAGRNLLLTGELLKVKVMFNKAVPADLSSE